MGAYSNACHLSVPAGTSIVLISVEFVAGSTIKTAPANAGAQSEKTADSAANRCQIRESSQITGMLHGQDVHTMGTKCSCHRNEVVRCHANSPPSDRRDAIAVKSKVTFYLRVAKFSSLELS